MSFEQKENGKRYIHNIQYSSPSFSFWLSVDSVNFLSYNVRIVCTVRWVYRIDIYIDAVYGETCRAPCSSVGRFDSKEQQQQQNKQCWWLVMIVVGQLYAKTVHHTFTGIIHMVYMVRRVFYRNGIFKHWHIISGFSEKHCYRTHARALYMVIYICDCNRK